LIKRSKTGVLNSKTISLRPNLARKPHQTNASENLLKRQKHTHKEMKSRIPKKTSRKPKHEKMIRDFPRLDKKISQRS